MKASGANPAQVDRAAAGVSGRAQEPRATHGRVRMRRPIGAHAAVRTSQPAHGSAVPASLEEKLARFAAGECDDAERAEVKKLLLCRSDLLPVLVAKLRTLSSRPE